MSPEPETVRVPSSDSAQVRFSPHVPELAASATVGQKLMQGADPGEYAALRLRRAPGALLPPPGLGGRGPPHVGAGGPARDAGGALAGR